MSECPGRGATVPRTTLWRSAAAAFLACACIAAMPTGSRAAETLRVGKAGREAFSFVPADIGQRTGIFTKHGLALEIASFGGDARVQQAMAAHGIGVVRDSAPGVASLRKGS